MALGRALERAPPVGRDVLVVAKARLDFRVRKQRPAALRLAPLHVPADRAGGREILRRIT